MFYNFDFTKYYKLPFKLGRNNTIVDSDNKLIIDNVHRNNGTVVNRRFLKNIVQVLNGSKCIILTPSNSVFYVSRVNGNIFKLYTTSMTGDIDYIMNIHLMNDTSMIRCIQYRLNKYYSFNGLGMYYEKDKVEKN